MGIWLRWGPAWNGKCVELEFVGDVKSDVEMSFAIWIFQCLTVEFDLKVLTSTVQVSKPYHVKSDFTFMAQIIVFPETHKQGKIASLHVPQLAGKKLCAK